MTTPSRPARRRRGRPVLSGGELVLLLVCASLVPSGVALTVLSPPAWPIPVLALLGALGLLVRGLLARPAPQPDAPSPVTPEVEAGIAEIEQWLAQRNHS